MEICLRIKYEYHKLLFRLAKVLLEFGLIDREFGALLIQVQANLALALIDQILDNRRRMVR